MADSGSSSGTSGHNNTNILQLKRTADNDSGISSSIKKKKPDDDLAATLTKPNHSGIKSFLHGISYQIKLCIFVCLANAKKALDPTNNFSFKVVAEDLDAGKFDDIVYYFTDGNKKGSLKIQAKHKIGTLIPKIILNDFMTERDGNNPFALQKYFVSFYDQKLQTADMEGLIICTNSDIDENAKDIWQAVDVNASTSNSTPSLDSYISSLFAKVGGKCYQLDYDTLKDGKLNKLYELFKQCTKRGRLVKLLVNAIKSKEKITRRNVLFKEYRLAILDIVDKQSISTNGSYGFTREFLDLSSPNTTPGYEAFRKEFDEQYQQEIINSSSSKDSSGLENLKLKRVFVAKDFLSDSKNNVSLPEIFPNDKDDESKLKTFCERFRFVCATKSEHEVDELILEFWRDLVSDDDQRKGAVEENVAIEKLFKTNFNWLMNPFAKPLHSDDIQKDLDNIKNTLAHIKLKGASEKLRKQVMGTSFRINPDALRNSELYEQVKNETILEIEACDMQFAGALLIDILSLDGKELHNTLLLEDAAFTDDSKTVEEVFRSAEHSIHLIIICDQAFKTVQSIIRRWRKDILKDTSKHVFLIRKVSDTPSELNCFAISDVSEDSWKQFLDENISFCTTNLSPAKLFQHTSPLSIEAFIKLLDWGKQMETDNNIEKNYRLIQNSYVQRYWIEQTRELKAENLDRDDYIEIYSRIHDIYKIQKNVLSFAEITEHVKKYSKFDKIFTETPNRWGDDEPIIENKTKKLLVLLGESGFGKSISYIVGCSIQPIGSLYRFPTLQKAFIEPGWNGYK